MKNTDLEQGLAHGSPQHRIPNPGSLVARVAERIIMLDVNPTIVQSAVVGLSSRAAWFSAFHSIGPKGVLLYFHSHTLNTESEGPTQIHGASCLALPPTSIPTHTHTRDLSAPGLRLWNNLVEGLDHSSKPLLAHQL